MTDQPVADNDMQSATRNLTSYVPGSLAAVQRQEPANVLLTTHGCAATKATIARSRSVTMPTLMIDRDREADAHPRPYPGDRESSERNRV